MRGGSSNGSRERRRPSEASLLADAHEEQVDAVLTALAPQDATDAVVPEAVFAAFAVHAQPDRARAAAPDRGRRSGSGAWCAGRAAAVKVGVAVLAVSSGTVAAAAAADILPAPAQRAAHGLFGSWGVPAPHVSPGAGTVSPSAPSAGTPVTGAPGAGPPQPGAARSKVTQPSDGDCPAANTRAAGAHCGKEAAAAGTAPVTPGAGHATKGAGHGHTASPHGDAAP